MRNTLLLVFITVLQAYANDTYSQNTKLTLNLNNVTVANVLEEIQNNSEFYFLFNAKLIDVEREVSISVEDKKISEILTSLFSGTGVNYLVYDRQIILTPSDITSLSAAIQQQKITGTVTGKDGTPITGANVVVTGTTQGTVTDIDGKYSIDVPQGSKSLTFSFIGMVPQEIIIGTSTQINVTLAESAVGLDEVVVVGYGTQKKVNLTGSVGVVNSDRLENAAPVANLDRVLEGMTPGLNVSTNLYGGEPGAKLSFNIRGLGSISGGSPYVLVDGVPADLSTINPNDVETISVLKDAASSAIYGARAAYGVILITTKSGKKDQKMKTTYSNSFSWSKPTVLPKSINPLDFAHDINIASVNSGLGPAFSDETLEKIRLHLLDPQLYPALTADPTTNYWGTWARTHGNTDWFDVIYKDWSFSQNHNLNVSGGSANTNYYVGAGWSKEGGKFNFVGDQYQKINLTSTIVSNITDKLTLTLKNMFSRNYGKYPTSIKGGNRQDIFLMLIRNWPTYPVYTPNGDLFGDVNITPFLRDGGSDEDYTVDLWLHPTIEYKITKNWNIKGDFSYNHNSYKRNFLTKIIRGLQSNGVTEMLHYSQTQNRIEEDFKYNEYISTNIISEFKKQLNNHFFGIMLGTQMELQQNASIIAIKRDLMSEIVPSISTGTGNLQTTDALSHWSTAGAFMRVNYNLSEKYLLEFDGRYDGSSRFGEGRRWGFFPSVSAGYNIWKENFWVPVAPVINTLKFRASYGSLGNQNVPNYLHIETLPISTNLNWIIDGVLPAYTTIPSNASIGLTWETSKTLNLGFDAGFLNNQLNINFDWYSRQTLDMFGPSETLPGVYGTSTPKANNAALKTTGVELNITWRQVVNDDFMYNLNLIFSDNNSVITEYNNPTNLLSNYYVGQTIGEIWGYTSHGLFQSDEEANAWASQAELYSKWTAGDVKYEDLNGDGKVTRGKNTLDDHGDLSVIGNSSPRYLYGFNVGASYKQFDFNMFWQGVGKRDLVLSGTAFYGVYTNNTNSTFTQHNTDFWTPDNTDAYFAKPYLSNQNAKNQQTSTRYLQDGSYLRLRSMQLGYTLPSKIFNNKANLRVSVSGENLIDFTNIIDDYDPETAVGTSASQYAYPLSKAYYVGIKVTF